MASAAKRIAHLFEKLERPRDEAACALWLAEALARPGVRVLSFLNAHAVNLSAYNEGFYNALQSSDHLLRDGSGAKLGCRIMGLAPGPNMNGTDLIPQILDRFRARKIVLLGAERRWLDRAAEKLRGQGHTALIARDGYGAEEDYLALIRQERPELIVLGMGMPKQELLALRLKAVLEAVGGTALIVNGGAIIDFLGEKVTRAPQWLRRLGLEWVYRLWLEPRRLARRYLIGNLVFFWHVLRVASGAGLGDTPTLAGGSRRTRI
jgi:exopolysaccharide biosynthesis WecB/TagA/CpsF family protein